MNKLHKHIACERKPLARGGHRDGAGEGGGVSPVLLCRADRRGVLFLGDSTLPERIEVHAVVEDTLASLPRYLLQDYSIVIEPFATSQGRCAVLQDLEGNRLCILERRGSFVGAV